MNNNKMWFNKNFDKILLPFLIIITCIFAGVEILFVISIYIINIVVADKNISVLISIFDITTIVIIPFIFIIPFWGLYILFKKIKKGEKININKYPLLKQLYNIRLIPYNANFEIPNLQIEKTYYFRDLPCKNDLLLVMWISFQCKITDKPQDFMGAVLLKLIKDNRSGFINNNNDGYYLDVTKITKCEHEYEYVLLDILKAAAIDGIVKENTFKEWCNKNYKKLSSWYSYFLKFEEEQLISNGLIIKKNTIINKLNNLIQHKKEILVCSKNMEEIIKNLIGLKQFLLDFSLMKEKKIMDIYLWEYYLIYAKIFGIADKLEKEFKDIYPNFIDLFDNLEVLLVMDENGYVDIQ